MQSKTIALVAGLILLAALVSLRFTLRTAMPQVDHALYTSLGQGLALEAATAIQDRGQIVAVIADFHSNSSTFWREQWQAFTGELKKHSAISLAPSEIVNSVHISLVDILDRHPQAGAIVYFTDPPDALELEAVASRPALPKIVVVGNLDLSVKSYYGKFITSGILTAVIVPRSVTDVAPPTEPKTPREWLDRYYRVYTPQNLDSLPDTEEVH